MGLAGCAPKQASEAKETDVSGGGAMPGFMVAPEMRLRGNDGYMR